MTMNDKKPTLIGFLRALPTTLTAKQMSVAAKKAGIKHSLNSVYTARNVLGITSASAKQPAPTVAKQQPKPKEAASPKPSEQNWEAAFNLLVARIGTIRARQLLELAESREYS